MEGGFFNDLILFQAAYAPAPGHPPPNPQQQQYSGYTQPGAAPAPGAAGNPYSRGPSYGQYPRPQGQYPQTGYQQ